MKKALVLLVIFAMALFITGCGEQTSTGKTFIGGTEGLKTTFLAGNPPDTTTDGKSGGFSIVVKLENVGENDIKAGDGYVQIWGLDTGIYGATDPDFKQLFRTDNGFNPSLRGAVKNFDGTVLNGGVTTVTFANLAYQPIIQGDLQQKIWANICYNYATKMAAQICIKSTTEQALNNKDICSVEGEKNPQNSGGPIQITSLKESYAGNGKMGITIILTHQGSGDNFFKDDKATPECNDVESNSDRGKVWLGFKDIQVGGKYVAIECTGLEGSGARDVYKGGFTRMYKDGTGKETTTVYCTANTGVINNVVEVPVEAIVRYTYLQHISQDLTIRHVSQG